MKLETTQVIKWCCQSQYFLTIRYLCMTCKSVWRDVCLVIIMSILKDI